jgi:hypothetical protein
MCFLPVVLELFKKKNNKQKKKNRPRFRFIALTFTHIHTQKNLFTPVSFVPPFFQGKRA